MRIARPREDLFQNWRVDEALQALLQAPPPRAQPPCPNCCHYRPAVCSPACPDAACASSSEPQRFPIEPGVLPMVYELNALRVFQSCWSCEGHLDGEGRLWKRPRISFYAASSVCVLLLARYLQGLYQLKQLAHPWHIVVTDYGFSVVPTYCIEPSLDNPQTAHLGKLQGDLRTMAGDLGRCLRQYAADYLRHHGAQLQ